jgi:hypothetical protein
VKRLSADDTEGISPCGKYVIARRLFLTLFYSPPVEQTGDRVNTLSPFLFLKGFALQPTLIVE